VFMDLDDSLIASIRICGVRTRAHKVDLQYRYIVFLACTAEHVHAHHDQYRVNCSIDVCRQK
jgi:hypothetical protein